MQYSFQSNVLPAAMFLVEDVCMSALSLTDLEGLMSFSYVISFFIFLNCYFLFFSFNPFIAFALSICMQFNLH